ncbi:hypothetical protein I4U23_021718 [Adineta vaga]|nr:hypothetical protein I4U23_021718 [Adineta vaga]
MRSIGQLSSYSNLILSAGACLIFTLFIGIAVAVVVSLIPTYLSKQDLTPLGEKYCINQLQMLATINSSIAITAGASISTGYPLNQACYRILQNYKSDTLISLCSLSNCITNTTTTATNTPTSIFLLCPAIIYYSTRCIDQGITSGINNSLSSTGNSACRISRMKQINNALGSTSTTQYTNVPTVIIGSTSVTVYNITTLTFANYGQTGAMYCGSADQSTITTAINNQTVG